MKSLFDFPEVYEQTLGNRPEDVEQEVQSICELIKKFGIDASSILELGCGTCTHSIELAKTGYNMTGLDISKKMIEYAFKKAESQHISLNLHLGNFIKFDINQEFDCVIFMFETFPIISEYNDIKTHFKTVGKHLKSGGLYIVDMDLSRIGYGTEYEKWGERTVAINGGKVEIWSEGVPRDWVNGISHMKYHCKIYIKGEVHETVDEWRCRADRPVHLRMLIDSLPGWELVGFFTRDTLNTVLSDASHYSMVLKKII